MHGSYIYSNQHTLLQVEAQGYDLNEKDSHRDAIKNSPAEDPEGYSTLVRSTLCNVGRHNIPLPNLELGMGQEGKYEEEKLKLGGKAGIYRKSDTKLAYFRLDIFDWCLLVFALFALCLHNPRM